MRTAAKLYILAVVLLGGASLLFGLRSLDGAQPVRFAAHLLLALLGSGLKVSLPGVTGTMSVSVFFVLVGCAEFSLGETLALSCGATLVQVFWAARVRPKAVQVAFNLAAISLAVSTGHALLRFPPLQESGLERPLLLALAACVYFVVNTFPVAIVIALTEGRPLRTTWSKCYFWSFPYYLVGAAVAIIYSHVFRNWGWQTALLVLPVVYLAYHSYRQYLGRLEAEKGHAEEQRKNAEVQQNHAEEMAKLHLRTIEALALAIEAKDQTTHEHLARVQVYAVEVGRELGLVGTELDALRAAALLHDIGKLAVPEHIISKPGKLTPEEFEKMKIHPVVGAEILERVQFPYPVVPIVRSHHEKWDGSGYPDGLKGEAIPLGARILSAVDCLDALASDRQYRRALPLDQAMQVVVGDSGRAFDPQVVRILARRYVELEGIARGTQLEKARLSTDIRIERGDAPAAGFEQAGSSGSEPVPATGPTAVAGPAEFLASIAGARQEAQTMFELSQELGASLSLDDTLSVLASRLRRLVAHDAIVVWLRKGDTLVPEHVSGDDHRLFSSLAIPMGQGLSGWVAENRQPIVNGNPSVEPGYLNDPHKFSTLRSALAVPLEGMGGVVGVLSLYRAPADSFTRDHLRVLLAVTSKLALAIENTLKYRQAEDSATTDYLTGLPNARSLFLHLEFEAARCRALGRPLAVIVSDLNGFKQVNDRLGHLTGNQMLRAVAAELKAACRGSDYVARMGGDEFVIVLPEFRLDDLAATEERFRRATERASRACCGSDAVSLSVGTAHMPADGVDAERLLAEADRRMYAAKQESKRQRADETGARRGISLVS